jgi:hypothetical protein
MNRTALVYTPLLEYNIRDMYARGLLFKDIGQRKSQLDSVSILFDGKVI